MFEQGVIFISSPRHLHQGKHTGRQRNPPVDLSVCLAVERDSRRPEQQLMPDCVPSILVYAFDWESGKRKRSNGRGKREKVEVVLLCVFILLDFALYS